MSKSQKTKTEQTSDPWAPAQSHLKSILGEAEGAYNKGKNAQFFPGSTVTPFANQTLEALRRMESRANAGSAGIDSANRAVIQQLSGGYDNPALAYLDKSARGDFLNSNPYLDATFNNAADKVQSRVNSQFSGAGRFGSGAHQGVMQEGLGDLATQIYGGNYAQERGNQLQAQMGLGSLFGQGQDQQLQAAGMAPGLFEASFAPDQALGKVGGAFEQQYGNVLKDLMARYDFNQNNQWNQLAKYASLTQPIAASGGRQAGTTTQSQSALPGLLGAALSIGTAPMTGGTSLFGNLFS